MSDIQTHRNFRFRKSRQPDDLQQFGPWRFEIMVRDPIHNEWWCLSRTGSEEDQDEIEDYLWTIARMQIAASTQIVREYGSRKKR